MSEHRETATADLHQTIPRLVGNIAPFDYAQGRLRPGGRGRSCSQKICTKCKIFCEQDKTSTMLPQANRAIHSGNSLI
jgi:hypothetical protein